VFATRNEGKAGGRKRRWAQLSAKRAWAKGVWLCSVSPEGRGETGRAVKSALVGSQRRVKKRLADRAREIPPRCVQGTSLPLAFAEKNVPGG
jgi:hypothetical protein